MRIAIAHYVFFFFYYWSVTCEAHVSRSATSGATSSGTGPALKYTCPAPIDLYTPHFELSPASVASVPARSGGQNTGATSAVDRPRKRLTPAFLHLERHVSEGAFDTLATSREGVTWQGGRGGDWHVSPTSDSSATDVASTVALSLSLAFFLFTQILTSSFFK